ncbi:MAG: alpha/beta hydrolase [Chthoniobacter sp.]|uniref:alpha/beta fold hydrolase n=1 Tax=Chthoniobacter sp. TaxID=2510640 RepID=UPI0032A2E459
MKLESRVCGDGAVLLLLHGVTRCGRDWEPLLPELAHRWRVLALDQRGHGSSRRAASYLVTDYIEDAVQFVREEVAAPVVLIGHSLGAMVAAAVAADLRELVRAIVFEDPPFHTMGNRIHGTAWQAQFIGMQEAARRGGTIDQVTDALGAISLPTPEGGSRRLGEIRDRASLRWSAECLAQLDPDVLTPVIAGHWLDGYDVSSICARIRCPVLLLQADPQTGGALTDGDAQLALRSIADCRHVPFPRAGHQIHRDRPEAMLQVVREFAATLPAE